MHRQHVVFFVGPDMCGKTEIAKATAASLDVPYFKASSEHDSYLSSKVTRREVFLNQLRYADPRVFDVLKQSGYSLVFDRGFPCEWVYSRVFNRETDLTMLQHMDEMWSTIDARVVFCHRSSYEGIVDDLDSKITAQVLRDIHVEYENFFVWSKCRHLSLNVDDEDLTREVADVTRFLTETH
jgi:deoxyadenosine/deoxycytidine kinase